jgi:putative spermidine/putrescine transport system ATP-binding protein
MMHNGRIEQIDDPQTMYERPRTVAVARFIGISNVLEGQVLAGDLIKTADGTFPLPPGHGGEVQALGALIIRPEHMNVVPSGQGVLHGKVIESVYAGVETRVVVRLASGNQIVVRRASGLPALPLGSVLGLEWLPQQSRFLSA